MRISLRETAELCCVLCWLNICTVARHRGRGAAALAAGCAGARGCGAARAPRGSGTEALRIVVISQLSGAVSAQRLNKALKINHSSFLGANSHSKLLQSSQSIYRRHGLHTHLSVSCDSNTRERKVGEGRERTLIAAVAVT